MTGAGRRRRSRRRSDDSWEAAILGWEAVSTTSHEERLDAVIERLLEGGTEAVLDIGCGSGALLRRLLAEPHLRRIVGVDPSPRAMREAEQALLAQDGARHGRLSLRQGSAIGLDPDLSGFDAAALVETIEHLHPVDLSGLEASVFARVRPGRVVVTTPNRDYNVLLGLGRDEYRHPHHRFEWGRQKFQRWADGVARRNRYRVRFEGIGPANAWYGSATQMAVFDRST